MPAEEIVQMKKVSKAFPGIQALKEVTFSCYQGEIHALVGENGAGKSTMIKILGGVFPPDKGEIVVKGRLCHFKSPSDAQRLGIGVVHQEFSLVPYISVAENLFLGMEKRYSKRRFWFHAANLCRRAEEVLSSLGLEIDPRALVCELGPAQQKWVEIAKALLRKPEVLILDEPTAPFSNQEVSHLFHLLRELKREGTTVVYISHRLDELPQIADRVTVLKDGEKVGTYAINEITEDELILRMTGRKLGELFPPKRKRTRRNKILEIRNLCLDDILRDINLDLYEGEILGIGGLKGHGQDILLRTIFGVYPLNRGEIRVYGKKAQIRSPRDACRLGIALVTDRKEVEGLCMVLPIRHNMALPTLHQRQVLGFIQMKKETRDLHSMANALAIHAPSLGQRVRQLSGGNKQKVVIGKWLLTDPRIILAIDPTAGIDVATKQQLYHLFRRLADEGNKSIILVSSEMKELLGLCDRIVVMREGGIVAEFGSDEATEENILRAAIGVRR